MGKGYDMKFYPLDTVTAQVGEEGLNSEYKTAREIGKVKMGELRLFVKSGLKTYYIPYHDIRRMFRRVLAVPAKLCCGKGDFEIENLVICGADDKELAQIQLPGKKAAQILMEELKQRVPEAEFGRPAPANAQE